ncbi:MAG TPA: phosphotransferase, partial [Ilumatobacteraceae bacterium]|nr:phosphotransferase [Ilumatobacteraceae bacterium]
GIDADAAAGVIDDLAALHARFEDPARRKAEAPWVIKHRVNRDYGPGLLRYGLTNHRDRLSDEFATIAELYISHPDEMQELWRQGPTTIIHGDTHIGNLFIEGNRVGFLDWGIINVNSALRELGYFLTMSMDIDARRGAEVDLIRHYLDRRRANGAAEVSFDEAWRCYRQQAAYNVLASAQVVTFPENATPARKVFANAFLARAEASIADLDTVSALRDVGLG